MDSLCIQILPLLAALTAAAEECPPASDLSRFPPLVVAEQFRTIALANRLRLESMLGYPWEGIRPTLPTEAAAAHATWDAWDDLCLAHRAADQGLRRSMLRRIRATLGMHDYCAGLMPEPLPRLHPLP